MLDLYVVGVKKALLGRPAIEALSLVSRINSRELFQGWLGTMKGDYIIKLTQVLNLFSLSTPRRIAVPLLPKLKAELEHMCYHKVEKTTDWCSKIVVVPKPFVYIFLS